MKFKNLHNGASFTFQTGNGTTVGPLIKISNTSAKDGNGAQYFIKDDMDVSRNWISVRREMCRREAWEYMAYEWNSASKGADGKFYAMERNSIYKCISSLWMDNLLSWQDKERMQKDLGKNNGADEEVFGHSEEDAKNRVGFCVERAIIEVDSSEILICDGRGK